MRKLCWWAAAFSGAIFLSVFLLPESAFVPAGVLCVLGWLVSLLFRGAVWKPLPLLVAGLALGFLWTGLYDALFRAPAHVLASDQVQTCTFTVTAFPSGSNWGSAFTASLTLDGAPDPVVQLYADEDALDLQPGDRISCPVRLAPSYSIRGQSVDYYQAKGIYLRGYLQDGFHLLERPSRPSPRFWPQFMARTLKDSILAHFPADVSGFFAALILGEKNQLPTGMYASFQRSGISHVIVVSGLHISFLAGLLALLFGRRSRLSALLSMALMFFFAAMAGNTPSALRAAFLSSLLLWAPLAGREPDKPTALSFVLFLVLLPCPYAASSISLQLSFAAVAGIYLITEPLTSRWLRAIPKWGNPFGKLVRRLLAFLVCSLAITIGALLFTTPLSALYFRSLSLVGPLTNLLTLWAVSGSFLGGVLAAIAGLFSPPLASVLAWIAAWPARWVLFAARQIARWPFSSLALLSGYLTVWFVFAYGILLLWLIAGKGKRPTIPLSAVVITLCAALLTHTWSAMRGSLTVSALDVGEGASTLFYSKGHSVLVDCGGNSGDDPGDIAADYLQSLGSSRLDALILTHCHSDHACGVPQLLSRVQVPLLILPALSSEDPAQGEILALARENNCEVIFLSEDASLTFGDASMALYAPLGDGGRNEEGLSLLCSAGNFEVLLTGDMNDVVEKRLVKYKDLPDIDLLMVGHHGSKSSTSEELLLAVTPETAIISSGYNNYGHPALETLERLGAAGCDIYRTDLMGTVTITVKGD